VPAADRFEGRGGRQRPALHRPVFQSGDARRENAPSPGLVRIEGPRALRCPLPRPLRSSSGRARGGAARDERRADEHEGDDPSGRAGPTPRRRLAPGTRDVWGARRDSSEVQTSVRTHRERDARVPRESVRSGTRGLARTTSGSRGDARIGGEDERIGARASPHAVHEMARRGSVERAQAALGATSQRGAGLGTREVHRVASAIDSDTKSGCSARGRAPSKPGRRGRDPGLAVNTRRAHDSARIELATRT